MTTPQICANSLAGGKPIVVLSERHPAGPMLAAAGLLPLERQGDVLQPPGQVAAQLAPLPPDAPLLAVLAEDPANAAALAAGLPHTIARLGAGDPRPALFQLLAQRLTQEVLHHRATMAAHNLALRALGGTPPTAPVLVLELPPSANGQVMPARFRQRLGQEIEGLCTIELHLQGELPAASAGPRGLLRAWLSVAGRVVGAWVVPGSALVPGWLALDLPAPLPPGPDAVLDVAIDGAEGERLAISAAEAHEGAASMALRLCAAAPARQVLPLHFDWVVAGQMIAPGLLHALPDGALTRARLTGARGSLAAAGAEAPRLMLELPAGGSAELLLPPMPCGVADLAVLELNSAEGMAKGLEVTLLAGAPETQAPRRSPAQMADAAGSVRIALPLPVLPGGMLRLGVLLRHAGTAPLTVEIARFGVMLGALGEARDPAPPRAAAKAPVSPTKEAPPEPVKELSPPAPQTSLPVAPPAPAVEPPPQPEPPAAIAPAAPPEPVRPPLAAKHAAAANTTTFRDVRLHQHLANPEGTYRHLEVTLSSLVSTAGLWRQVRFKLFDRRGVVGLEFRDLKGWPQMFDIWPPGRSDKFGPFWRLETEDAAAALLQLATPRDRALVRALLDVMGEVARRAATEAGLDQAEQMGWSDRAELLVQATMAALAGAIPDGPQSD